MKRLAILSIFLMILSVLAIGCSKEAPMHPEEAQKEAEEAAKAMPDIGEAAPEAETAPEVSPEAATTEPAPETPVEEAAPVEKVAEVKPEAAEDGSGSLGTRYYGDEPEAFDQKVPELEDQVVVNLLGETKTMDSGDLNVKVGTTVTYKNTDSWPHALAVESGKSYDTVRYTEQRLEAGQVWSYQFNDPGTFLVRDMFSGTMRHQVTVT